MRGSTVQSIAALVAATGIISAILCFSSTEFMKPNMEHSQQQDRRRRRLSGVSDPKTVEFKSAPFYIVQASPPRSGSTLMANLITGYFDSLDNDICFVANDFMESDPRSPTSCLRYSHVVKTHVSKIDDLHNWILQTGVPNIFYISTNRDGITLAGDDFCAQENVICFEYMNFVYSNEVEMADVAHRVANRIKFEFPGLEPLVNEEAGLQRLKDMEEMTKMMADKPFSLVNSKFSIHGGHRAHWGQP